MTYRGHIKNGVAVLDTPVSLPEGTPVRIEVEGSAFWQNRSAEQLAREQGIARPPELCELAGEWPQDDSIDEFLAFIREARR